VSIGLRNQLWISELVRVDEEALRWGVEMDDKAGNFNANLQQATTKQYRNNRSKPTINLSKLHKV
jgi:hypothetical protein